MTSRKAEKCMLGNGLLHLGRAPSRGHQTMLKVYQPSFIRLSARNVPARRMRKELAIADGRDQSLIASQGT